MERTRTRDGQLTKDSEYTREALVLRYAPLVRKAARYYRLRVSPHVEYADLVGYGFLGLLDAIDRFDPERGVEFEAYARIRINGAIGDGIRAEARLPRSIQEKARKLNHAYEVLCAALNRLPTEKELADYLEISLSELRQLLVEVDQAFVSSLDDAVFLHAGEEGGLSLLDTLPDDGSFDPSALSETRATEEMVREAVNDLAEREKLVLLLYYYEDLTMREIGEVLGISESRVSKIHSTALTHLKSRLAKAV